MKFPTFKGFTWRRLIFAALVYFAASSVYDAMPTIHQYMRDRKHANAPVTIAQASSHMVIFVDKDEKPQTECSSTAIGPHTILTAAHCNPGKDDDHFNEVKLDYAVRNYHILAELDDGQDHTMLLLDGPAFKEFFPTLKPAVVPKPGDEVVLYGDGQGQYPPLPKYGVIDGAMTDADVSDVDQGDGVMYYTIHAVHGDSGSAIYDLKDGRIIGLLTYGIGREEAASFALAFPPDAEQLLEIAAAKAAKADVEVAKPQPKKKLEDIISDF